MKMYTIKQSTKPMIAMLCNLIYPITGLSNTQPIYSVSLLTILTELKHSALTKKTPHYNHHQSLVCTQVLQVMERPLTHKMTKQSYRYLSDTIIFTKQVLHSRQSIISYTYLIIK